MTSLTLPLEKGAMVYTAQDSSLVIVKDRVNILNEAAQPIDSLKILINKAKALLPKDAKKAIQLATEIKNSLDTLNYPSEEAEILHLQYQAQKIIGNDSLSYVKLDEYISLKRKLTDSSNAISMASINKKYKLSQREKELQLLRTQKEIQNLQLRRNKMMANIALPFFLILLILSYILWKQYKKKQGLQATLHTHHEKTKVLNQELKDINTELLQAELQLKQVNETKDKFFTVVSQDLKSPINSLSILLQQFIVKKDISQENVGHFITRINESVTNLSTLINNLLEWSRLQMGNIDFQPEPLSLTETLQENIALIRPQWEDKKIDLDYSISPERTILVDKQMIGFVIRSLLSRLFNLSEENATISIELINDNPGEAFVHLSFTCSKVNSQEEDLLKTWDIDGQYLKDSSPSRNRGLGLVLSKEFLEKHKGHIEISHQKNDNLVVIIKLPLAKNK